MKKIVVLLVAFASLFSLLSFETHAVLPGEYSSQTEGRSHTHTWDTFACSGSWAGSNTTSQTCDLNASNCTYTENLYYSAARCLECGEIVYNNPAFKHPEIRYHSKCGTKYVCSWDGSVMSHDELN